MKLLKPKFWGEKNLISVLLSPIALTVQIYNKIREKMSKQNAFRIPIICVGNIYLGGTGKTPLSITIAQELIKHKKKPAIVRKFYANHEDEHNLINNKVKCLYLGKKRSEAIRDAQNNGCDVAILDDGFQDYSIKKDLNILCFNSKQLIGNGMTLPSGPLREGLNAIRKSNIIVINGVKNDLFEKNIYEISDKVNIIYSKYISSNLEDFKSKKLFAFAGIGNPDNFFDLLKENNLNVQKTHSFPDHYEFSKIELQKIIDESDKNNLDIITTEKDYHRIKVYGFDKIKYLKTELEIIEKERLVNLILEYL